jgi:S-formylglutathione hydrolase FrmB
VSFHTFDNDVAKAKVSYHIYAPAAYDQTPQRRFPVVYWLHGPVVDWLVLRKSQLTLMLPSKMEIRVQSYYL